MSDEKFELRELKSQDIFPMFKILGNIGIDELKDVMSGENIKSLIASTNADENGDVTTVLGFNLVLEIAGVVMNNLPKCEKDIYKFLAGLSGKSEKQIADLSMVTFTEMIIAVIEKDEFKDFFKVVSRLFNKVN